MDKFWKFLAWRLPKKLIYWSAIRLIAFATQGNAYKNTIVPELKVMDALQRWDTCQNCGQEDKGQTGEYPCPVCGLPFLWDEAVP